MNIHVPPHLSEARFRDFEDDIRQIVDTLPLPTRFPPGRLTQATHSRYLRNAMKSLLRFQWQTDIDILKLKDYWEAIVVSEAPSGDIVVLNKAQAKSRRHADVPTSIHIDVDAPSPNIISALAYLISNEVIQSARITNMPLDEVREHVGDDLDVGVIDEGDAIIIA